MSKYPKEFPEKFEEEILPKGAAHKRKTVYRIIKSGKIDREGFISTYEEVKRGLIPEPKRGLNLNDPGTYSTSCNMVYEEAEYWLDVFMRHHPKALIAKGITEPSCGPSQLTSEREARDDTHVDWWIYEEAQPQIFFEEVDDCDA